MKKPRKHIACKVGDHSGGPARDVCPGHTSVTLFTDDGAVWTVADLPTPLLKAVQRQARTEEQTLNRLLSAIIVDGFEKLVEKGGAS